MLKKLIACLLTLCSFVSFASPAFIQHKIINKTNMDFNFILRQLYHNPIYGCMEHIDANSEKTCSGEFDNSNGFFIFDLFTNTNSKMDMRTTIRTSGITNIQNPSLTWLITLKGQDDINIQVKFN